MRSRGHNERWSSESLKPDVATSLSTLLCNVVSDERQLIGILSARWIGYSSIAIFLAALVTSTSAVAESKLTDLNGEWRGTGTDRDLPIENFQKTICHTKIEADESHMNSVIVCNGQQGLHKVIRLTVTLDGDKFTGSVSHTTLVRGGTTPEVVKGSVSGQRAKDTINLGIRLPGLLPNAAVDLVLRNPSSYTMHVSSLGLTTMNVTFNKVEKP
jgi:hypothetical protein